MASVVVNGDTSGAVTLSAPAVAGTVTVTLPSASGTMAVLPTATGVLAESAGGTGTTTGYYGFKNRIINGAMVIDQRNAGASVSVGGGAYTLDRWAYDPSATLSWFTFQQNGGSVTPPAGFSSYLGITSTGANSPTSGQFALLNQYIEGFNTADLAWGTASAATVTLSFWVRSSLTGTFGGALANSAFNRSYPFTYTITSANTWEQKSITITGDTSGTWVTNNGVGIRVIFGLGVGSSSLGTAGAWAGATYRSATGATNISATSGATFYITGVQLEKGSTATSFDYRPYGTELALCERYYWKSTVGTYNAVGSGAVTGSSQVSIYIKYPTTMRSAPTLSYSGTVYVFGISNQTITSISASYAGNSSGRFDFVPTATMTTGGGAILFTEQTGTNFVQATAEL